MTGGDDTRVGILGEGVRQPLDGLAPARSRHNWTRTAVAVAGRTIVVGGPDGRVTAFDSDPDPDSTLEERWTVSAGSGYAVSLAATDRWVVVGTRGPDAGVAVRSLPTGEARWTHPAAEEVGTAAGDSLFEQPHVVDIAVAGGADETVVAAVGRYERTGGEPVRSSAVLGFAPDGDILWRHTAAASPTAVDTHDGRVAVAYNRRSAGDGLVVLDAATGDELASWDPDASGDRRVGDVAFVGDGAIAVASHADKRGYLLDPEGTERWRVDLGTPRSVGGETAYTYPTHVCAADGTPVFVTGNTFAESTRDPDARHPGEHTVTAVGGGEVAWTHAVGGFARGVSTAGPLIVVPSAQHFRRRDADTHAVHRFDARDGHLGTRSVRGIAAAVAVGGSRLAAVEEPVAYHDEGIERGAHRLHAWRLDTSEREP
jgi:hypothetical protein